MAAKYHLKKSTSGDFHFNLKAGNGETILTSETYESKSGAINGIESVKTNSAQEERYERLENKSGDPYFILKAGNHQQIGRSESYSSKSAMESGIESVKKNGPSAETVDETN